MGRGGAFAVLFSSVGTDKKKIDYNLEMLQSKVLCFTPLISTQSL